MKLPKELKGGGRFDAPFVEAPVKAGQVWRKSGPCDALKVERVMLPGTPDDDGGAPGIVCRFSKIARGRIVWGQRFFRLARSEAELLAEMKKEGRALCSG